jgi:hypothetical protein
VLLEVICNLVFAADIYMQVMGALHCIALYYIYIYMQILSMAAEDAPQSYWCGI